MTKLLAHFRVASYENWRAVYDEKYDLRYSAGMTDENVFRVNDAPNELVVIQQWPTFAKAQAFAASPEFKQALQKSGVLEPEILILDQVISAQEIAQKYMRAVEAQDWTRARALMHDDLKFTGAVPKPIGADEALRIQRAFSSGMPDFKFNYKPTGGSGNIAKGTARISGKHTRTFTPPIPGASPISATDKNVLLPLEHVTITVQDGKIIEWQVEDVPNGGVMGILAQLGAVVPAH